MSEYICPHCRQPIYDDEALLCHFCGESLNRTSRGATGWMRGASGKWLWVTVAVVLTLGVLLFFFRP